MVDPLDLAQLQSLIAIAKTGGFRRAGEAMHISQPTVSRHVRLREKRLRQTLVEKERSRSRFTPVWNDWAGEARVLAAVHGETLKRFNASDLDTTTIGSTEHAADLVFPDLLAAGLRGAA